MKYIVDIDGTICETVNKDYANSKPNKERIALINHLFDQGNEIHYWTARGSLSGVDYLPLTVNQLNEWGCKYTTANVGKPSYDTWVDDKAFNDKEFFNDIDNGF